MNLKKLRSQVSITETLHKDIDAAIKGTSSPHINKKTVVDKAIKGVASKYEKSGIEGNMPKGSSRAWLTHEEPTHVQIDGHHTRMKTGTKFAITSSLDKHRDKEKYPDSLGTMQNQTENGDYYVNQHHRVLANDPDHRHDPSDPTSPKEKYKTNEHGIFPPLVDHDHEHHQWSEIGHSRDLKAGDFNRITKSPDHPKGISHSDFTSSMNRFHDSHNGRYHKSDEKHEAHLDHVDSHPLVQNFQDYHGNFGHSPKDYEQKKNLGVWKHPVTGKEHIVARDHGFSNEVEKAYRDTRRKTNK